MLLRLFASTIILLGFAINMTAQVRQPVKKTSSKQAVFADLTLTIGIPMEGFANTTSSLPFGFTLNYLYQPKTRLPFAFGGGITYLSAGSRRINRNLTADITVGNTIIDQLVIPLEFRISNQIVNAHGVMRIQGPSEYFKPYMDLYAGFSYFWTSTALFDRSQEGFFDTNDNNRIFRQSQSNDITWNLGAGAGFMIKVGPSTLLNLGASYMLGGAVNYYDRGQIDTWNIELNASNFNPAQAEQNFSQDDIDVNAIPKRSRTPMIFAQGGVTFIL